LDIKDIEALYGVKPDMPKSMEYKKNIMEDAHPDSVVLSPAYDRLNGLVENNIERQNIILNIIDKVPTGQLTNKRYAEQELILSLVRLGNDLDNQNKDELMVLADTCLEQVNFAQRKSLVKTALSMLAITELIAASFGAIYAWQHLPNISRGFKQDSARLKDAVTSLMTSTVDYGFGIEVADNVKADMAKFLKYLNDFETTYDRLYPIIVALEKPLDAKELFEQDNQEKAKNASKAIQLLKKKLDYFRPFMMQVKANFSKPSYKAMVTKDTGYVTDLAEQVHLYGGATSLLFADKFESIVTEIPAYISSIDEIIKVLNDSQSQAAVVGQSLVSSFREGGSGNAVPDMKMNEEELDEIKKQIGG
jgi:hypothetical protein